MAGMRTTATRTELGFGGFKNAGAQRVGQRFAAFKFDEFFESLGDGRAFASQSGQSAGFIK